MKHLYMIAALCFACLGSKAQITLTQNDFAGAGDDIVVSHADVNTPVDITTTGANQTWDYSSLVPASQDTSSFLSIGSTGGTYSLYYANVGFNSNRSNIAVSGGDIPNIPNLPITLSDPYSFYYKSSSDYRQQGLGITISGLQTPIAYSSKDILYTFPVDYNNADSCNAAWDISIPNLGYYGFTQKRVNHVDGWGTLITPYGTFSALRIRTVLAAHDSLYADTLGFGYGMDRAVVTEYKWFGQNQLIPLLQITTMDMTGLEVVTDIAYRDSVRNNVGIAQLSANTSVQIMPNPATDYINVEINSSKSQELNLTVTDALGAVAYQDNFTMNAGHYLKQIPARQWAAGIYSLTLSSQEGKVVKKIVIR
ncbi:MAG: T9SS type A sorting domain-containing protein [Bacteroidia bacterium]|nr:T9SS type A sorting domain-containing protein [Bacteroidia bacterium]